jgi:phospholipid/cholesterol/gamma-HCH transport system substrate-binding protein
MVKPFRERHPTLLGAIGLTIVAAATLAAFHADDLPLIGGGDDYSAAFTEAAGIRPENEVRVAGVKVGKVTGVDLDGGHVRVDFRVDSDDLKLPERTGATIRIKTLLGQKYLALDPRGTGRMEPGEEIPLSRTASPYDVVEAVNGLGSTVDRIDSEQLAKAFETISTTFADTPEEVNSALSGLSRLSKTVASRDAQLGTLLSRARNVTRVLAERDTEFTKLISDGNLLLNEVKLRREAIHKLLVSTNDLSVQLSGLVSDNAKQLEPALQQLRSVVALLQRNQTSIDKSIRLLGPFVRAFTNVLGNGRWFDTYVDGLIPPPLTPKVKVPAPTLPASSSAGSPAGSAGGGRR